MKKAEIIEKINGSIAGFIDPSTDITVKHLAAILSGVESVGKIRGLEAELKAEKVSASTLVIELEKVNTKLSANESAPARSKKGSVTVEHNGHNYEIMHSMRLRADAAQDFKVYTPAQLAKSPLILSKLIKRQSDNVRLVTKEK